MDNKINYVTLNDIKTASENLAKSENYLRTPLIKNIQNYSKIMESKNFSSLNFKMENMQKEGSYKIRGIMNFITNIDKNNKFVTFSGGNFARSFAYVSKQLRLDSTIVMPEDVPVSRVEICKKYGSNVVLSKRSELLNTVNDFVKKGYKAIHPFDSPVIVSGCGTIGLEILEDLPEVDLVIVGIGGGALVSGIAAAMKLSGSKAKIIGVEPEGAAKMFNSLKEGKAHTLKAINTFASGLSPPFTVPMVYEHTKKFVDEVVLVSDDSIKKAMNIFYHDYKLVVESSGSACLAAILENKIDVKGKKVVCLLSGGNVSVDELQKVFIDVSKMPKF